MNPSIERSDPHSSERLVELASEARERLLLSVEALDRKRHELAKPITAVVTTLDAARRGLARPSTLVVGAVIATGLVGAIIGIALTRKRRRRSGMRIFWRAVP